MTDAREVLIEVIKGPEGHALYIGDLRIAGPKPWGGGEAIHKWRVRLEHIREAVEHAESGT